jgi:serine/threonine protein kinase
MKTTEMLSDYSKYEESFSTSTITSQSPIYKVFEKIRSGGFGDVYKGIRRKDNYAVAVKIIKKEKINTWTTTVSIQKKKKKKKNF